MFKKVRANIFYSSIEKVMVILFQFLAGIMLVRLLGEQKFGIMGVAAGGLSIISLLNISWEAVIFRKLEALGQKFFYFNIIKSILILILAMIAGFFLSLKFSDTDYIWGMLALTLPLIYDNMASYYLLLSSLQFKQKIATVIVTIRWVLNLILMIGLFFFPTLSYVVFKEFILLVVLLSIWSHVLPRYLGRKVSLERMNKEDWKKLFHDFRGYIIWNHFTTVLAQMIYKIDALILSFFAPSSVAKYSVALSAANPAAVLPGILTYQSTVTNANADMSESVNISATFFRATFLIGVGVLAAYLLLGRFYLRLLTGKEDVEETYQYLLIIVSALLIIKTCVSSLVAYINVRGSVKNLFLKVTLPTGIIGLISYTVGSYYFGALGSSWANILIAFVWFALILRETSKLGFPLSELINFRKDFNMVLASLR